MMRTYKFDDEVLSPARFRFHVLRTLSVRKHLSQLVKKQKGVCGIHGCQRAGKALGKGVVVHHIKSVQSFANDLTIPLTEAYRRCHAISNLRAVHRKCHNHRHRKRDTSLKKRSKPNEARG